MMGRGDEQPKVDARTIGIARERINRRFSDALVGAVSLGPVIPPTKTVNSERPDDDHRFKPAHSRGRSQLGLKDQRCVP